MTKGISYKAQTSAFAKGESSPVTVLEDCLSKIDARDGDVKAFVCLALDNAREAAVASAERWKKGKPLSPIDGMPVAVKDIIETADMPTGQGSPLWEGFES